MRQCDTMAGHQDAIVNDYLRGETFGKTCMYAGLCWME